MIQSGHFKLTIALGLLASTMIFQNCGAVKFATTGAATNLAENKTALDPASFPNGTDTSNPGGTRGTPGISLSDDEDHGNRGGNGDGLGAGGTRNGNGTGNGGSGADSLADQEIAEICNPGGLTRTDWTIKQSN